MKIMFSEHVYCRCYFFGLASQLARIAVSTNLRDLGNENGKADKHTDKLPKECKDESVPGNLGNGISIVRMIVRLYLVMLCLFFEVLELMFGSASGFFDAKGGVWGGSAS